MPQGLMYVATFDAIAATVETDLFELNVASDCVVILHSLFLGQTTDMGDAAAEALKLQFIKGYSTSGSGGSSLTPTPMQTGFPAAGSTMERNNSTVANTGTAVILHQDVWNIQLPYQWRPTPEERIALSPSQRLVIRLPAPADSITLSATLVFEELGG